MERLKILMNSKTTNLLLLIVVILFALFVYEKTRFPVKYTICDSLYENCFVHAKFEDMDSCKWVEEISGMYCDSTNRQHIICEARDNETSAAGYCSK